MRKLISLIVAMGLAAVFAGPTFAADAPKTKAECVKANMKWHMLTQSARRQSRCGALRGVGFGRRRFFPTSRRR